jgi:anti-anti-sigma factor
MAGPESVPSSNPSFTVRPHGETCVVTFSHDTFNRLEIERVRDQLRSLIENSPCCQFVIDFQHVTFMSSVILGVVMGIHLHICRRRGQLVLCGLAPHIFDIFKLMRLDHILTIVPTVDDAIAMLRPA